MIELIADNVSFFVSLTTLRKYPNFIVNRMLETNNKTDLGGLVECIDRERFIFDTTPEVLADIVKKLRSLDGDTIIEKVFIADKSPKNAPIFSRPEQTTDVIDPLLQFLGSYDGHNKKNVTANSNELFINKIKDTHESMHDTKGLGKRLSHNVYRSRSQKIEIDT